MSSLENFSRDTHSAERKKSVGHPSTEHRDEEHAIHLGCLQRIADALERIASSLETKTENTGLPFMGDYR